MTPAAGPFAIAAGVLVVAGIAKAVRPTDTANALRAVGIPVPAAGVRVGGGAEAVLGAYALALGDRASAALVAVSYLGFAAFVALALARDAPLASCGCLGKADTPPSATHVVLDLFAIAAAVAVVLQPGAGLPDVIADQPLGGVPYLLLVVVGTTLALMAMTLLPQVMSLVRAQTESGGS